MIKKTILQGILLLVLFFALFYSLAQVDFVSIFQVKNNMKATENKIGDLIWDEMEREGKGITNDSILATLDQLMRPICTKNEIERDSLKIHLVANDEVNAFALPNNHLVVYTGLILKCRKQEALQGVLSHEMAHIQRNHVMKKLSKEIGLTILISATAGGNGVGVLKEILKTLSSTAYDRNLEKEADLEAVKYLLNANINPTPLADFMFELAYEKEDLKGLSWLSTHPESGARAKYILGSLKGKTLANKTTLSMGEWDSFKTRIKSDL
jgi:predicted Zn-dependent protease